VTSEVYLYEILVPTIRNNGRPFRTRFHRVWDQKVREISGGLTILKPAKGQWVDEDGDLFAERMIPVRIMCSAEDMDRIVDMSLVYYDQKAIMFYRVSDKVEIRKRSEE